MVWIVAALALGLGFLVWRGPNLTAEFRRMLVEEVASDAARPHPVVTEESIAGVPAPVQRHIRLSGAIGKPRPASLTVTYDAAMYSKPGAPPMMGVAVQYDRFDPPKRLFYLPTVMGGLPVRMLHDYEGTAASMRVRIAGLYTVVDNRGEAFSRIETVTLLNDLCLFAPGWLSDPRLTWTPVDDLTADVSFRNGPYTVRARLHFNAAGELVNFTSQDRGDVGPDGVIRKMPWSTPIGAYAEVGEQRVMTYGEAIWTRPDGDFAYGKFTVTGFETH